MGAGGFLFLTFFCFEGELLLTKGTERDFVSCSKRAILTEWQDTPWRQGHILNSCVGSRKEGSELESLVFSSPERDEGEGKGGEGSSHDPFKRQSLSGSYPLCISVQLVLAEDPRQAPCSPRASAAFQAVVTRLPLTPS